MTVQANESELLTIAEAARLLKVSRVTLHRWLKHGRLTAYHVGPRAVRIRRSDLGAIMTPIDHDRANREDGADTGLVWESHARPLTEEERQRGLAALESSRKLIEEMRAARGGVPLDESWPMIREAREERSRQI